MRHYFWMDNKDSDIKWRHPKWCAVIILCCWHLLPLQPWLFWVDCHFSVYPHTESPCSHHLIPMLSPCYPPKGLRDSHGFSARHMRYRMMADAAELLSAGLATLINKPFEGGAPVVPRWCPDVCGQVGGRWPPGKMTLASLSWIIESICKCWSHGTSVIWRIWRAESESTSFLILCGCCRSPFVGAACTCSCTNVFEVLVFLCTYTNNIQ